MKFIKAKKWNSALKTADKIKDREFRTLINGCILKPQVTLQHLMIIKNLSRESRLSKN